MLGTFSSGMPQVYDTIILRFNFLETLEVTY